ncbi:MAG: AI-2E family transporter [Planctomycetes bacterium]|nr:AI-2E family transporter [Planctomycetota bacterium]
MLERLDKTKRNIGLAAVAALLLWGGWTVRSVLNPLILGYLFAYILRPSVKGLENRGLRRREAVNVIFSAFAVVMTVTVLGVAFQAQQATERLMAASRSGHDPFAVAEARIDEVLEGASDWLHDMFGEDEPGHDGSSPQGSGTPGRSFTDLPGGLAPLAVEDAPARDPSGTEPEADGPTLRKLLRSWSAEFTAKVGDGGSSALVVWLLAVLSNLFGGALSIFAFLTLLPVYTYFLLFELERIHGFVHDHLPKRERERISRVATEIGSVLANFFRGRLLICFLKGAVITAGLMVAGVPHPFLLGMLSGFMALIPFAGPFLSFLLAYFVGLQRMEPLEAAIWIAPVYVVAEAIEGYVLIPKILGDSLGLHPVVILLAVFVGGSALGLFGFLIAVPLAATLIILFREFVMPALEEFAEEDSHVDPDPAEPGA